MKILKKLHKIKKQITISFILLIGITLLFLISNAYGNLTNKNDGDNITVNDWNNIVNTLKNRSNSNINSDTIKIKKLNLLDPSNNKITLDNYDGHLRILDDKKSKKYIHAKNGGAIFDYKVGVNIDAGTLESLSLNELKNAKLYVKEGNPTDKTVIENGNVGIGISNPQAKLHVKGNVKIQGGNICINNSCYNSSNNNNNNDLFQIKRTDGTFYYNNGNPSNLLNSNLNCDPGYRILNCRVLFEDNDSYNIYKNILDGNLRWTLSFGNNWCNLRYKFVNNPYGTFNRPFSAPFIAICIKN